VERRRLDHVVVQRPEGVVGEALVVVRQVVLGEAHRHEAHVVGVEGLEVQVGGAAPAHPRAVGLLHHRFQGGHQTTGGAGPARVPVVVQRHVHREAVRDDDQVITIRCHGSISSLVST
jgi:hypothetical protein